MNMRILEFKLLPHQKNFIKSTQNTILVAGYGSGKSYSGTLKTILKKIQFPQHKVAYYLPSYGLIRDIAFDKFPSLLEELKLTYKLNKTDKELEIVNYGKIIFRTLSEPETIVGYETAYSLIDEADILPMEKMDLAYKKILARNRAIENGNVDMVSTPESFKFLYAQCNSGHFEVIKARTYDNKFLPPDYIAQLEAQYPAQLLQAYLNGEFVNLQTGTVLYNFKREEHHSNEEYSGQNQIFVGQDFNIGGCVSIIYIESGDTLTAVDEIESYDTQQIINNIKSKYPNIIVNIYPDASGNQNKTSAPQTDINMLKNAGFRVFANAINPSVKDRYAITNKRLEDKKILVNTNKCPKLTKAMEQLAYNESGVPMKYNGPATIDDFCDAGTYPISFKYPITVKKPYVKVDIIPTISPMAGKFDIY